MEQEIQKIYSLYRITCLVNQKVYIGQSQDYQQRWRQHKYDATHKPTQVLHHAMKKHGIDNFIFEVIAQCKTLEDANETETLLVKQYESHISTGKGYNVSNGGSNAPKTDEWKQKMSNITKDNIKEHPDWFKSFLIAASTNQLGVKQSSERIAKRVSKLKGHPDWSSPESNKKISDTLKRKYKSGELKPPVGSKKPNKNSFTVGNIAPNKGRKRIVINGKIKYIKVS